MRKAVLIYNPESGGSRGGKRQTELESVVAMLRAAGVEANLCSPIRQGTRKRKPGWRLHSGCDTVFACGGDGTIHTVLQILARTTVALAILPLGTANALAHDLALPISIAGAARAALHGVARRVALGRVDFVDLKGSRERVFSS